MVDTELKAALEEQNKAWKAFKDANDERLAKLERGEGVAEIESKLDRLNSVIDAQSDAMNERVASLEVDMKNIEIGGGRGVVKDKAFDAFMRKGDESGFRASATVQVDSDGGWLVPENVNMTVDRIAQDVVAMRRLVTPMRISQGSGYVEFVTTSGAGASWVGETDTRDKTDTPNLARIETSVRELYALPKASQNLLDDAAVDIEGWLGQEVGVAFAEKEGAAFIEGDGVNQPRGILSYTNVIDSSYAWGSIGYVKTGAAAAFASSNPEDTLVSTVYALKSKYRNGAAWITNRNTLAAIRKFKTTMGYLWQPSYQAGEPSLLLGYPVEEDDNMPDQAANQYIMAFGNFQVAYRIVDHVAMRVLRDPYSAKPFVAFYTTKRVGGGMRHFEALKLVKCEA